MATVTNINDVLDGMWAWISRAAPAVGSQDGQALTADLNNWIAHCNQDPKPFVWHKTADEILDYLRTSMLRISDAAH